MLGSILGHFSEVFEKLKKLHSKNAFDLAILVGDTFATTDVGRDASESTATTQDLDLLLHGKIFPPLPTYFSLGLHPLPSSVKEKLDASGNDLCPNLSFIDNKSSIQTADGVRIVTLNGLTRPGRDGEDGEVDSAVVFSHHDVTSLSAKKDTHILITSRWPASVHHGSSVLKDAEDLPDMSSDVAHLCSATKPRYHFSMSPSHFYEREPFYHEDEQAEAGGHRCTRFISLAEFGNTAKQKWLYAFSLDLGPAASTTAPTGATPSPFNRPREKRQPLPEATQNPYRNNKRQRKDKPTSSECYFCLSNPNVEPHLIVSIGSEAYLTTAKGPLTDKHTFAETDVALHLLIIPLIHTPTLMAISDERERMNTNKEMEQYVAALQRLVEDVGQKTLGTVVWEVGRAGGVHAHWQFLPVPKHLIRRNLIDAAFKVEAQAEGYPSIGKIGHDEILMQEDDYFRFSVWTPDEIDSDEIASASNSSAEKSVQSHFLMKLDGEVRFDLQFGRRVLGKLLNLDKRLRWQDCRQSEQEETSDAETFKKAFLQYDFTLQS